MSHWMVLINGAKLGKWKANVAPDKEFPQRNCFLVAVHDETSVQDMKNMRAVHVGKMGVDSGTAGIFEDASYPEDPETLLDQVCSMEARSSSLFATGGETIGMMCRSGFGDGQYDVFCQKDSNGQVASVMVRLITPKDRQNWKELLAMHGMTR